jgi:uroporphyrinogen III methyltransferase/synthase
MSLFQPLLGKRVVVTRAPEQAQELITRLAEAGAEVLLLPTLAFRPPEDPAPLDQAIRNLNQFDWILFTSRNAVRFFCDRCRALGLDLPSGYTTRPQVAAVGPTTADAAQQRGIRVARVASRFLGVGLAEELRREVAGATILLPRSDRAREELPVALRALGAVVTEVVAYQTGTPAGTDRRLLDRILVGAVDVITFTSPTAFEHFLELSGGDRLRRLSDSVVLAAIGPVTAAAIRDAGFPVAIEAETSTAEGLVAALIAYFSGSWSTGAKAP